MSHIDRLCKGSAPLLILNVLESEKKYGYQIMRELEQRSDGYFTMTAALLYPTLHQLELDGLAGCVVLVLMSMGLAMIFSLHRLNAI